MLFGPLLTQTRDEIEMSMKKNMKKAITQPIVMFLLGIATTLLVIINITPILAENNIYGNELKYNELKFNDFSMQQSQSNQNRRHNETLQQNEHELDLENEKVEYLQNTERPLKNADDRDIPSPQNYFDTNQIKVYKNQVILTVDDIVWAGFEDTKSMLPIINKDSNALQIVPNCPEDIHLGDIVSYRSNYAPGIIIHRVIHIDEDAQGIYFVLKGDNNPASDPGRIRCNQIDRKVVAIIY